MSLETIYCIRDNTQKENILIGFLNTDVTISTTHIVSFECISYLTSTFTAYYFVIIIIFKYLVIIICPCAHVCLYVFQNQTVTHIGIGL